MLHFFKVSISTLHTGHCFSKHFSNASTHKGSLYIHWPYCARRCSYCQFNKYIIPKEISEREYMEKRMKKSLLTEMKTLLHLSGFQELVSIYYGGGTPSLMSPKTVQELNEEVLRIFSSSIKQRNLEITLEGNPGDLTKEKMMAFQEGGITRLSIGIQSLIDNDLKSMNRDHDVESGLRCIRNALDVFGAENISLDLIFGRESQTLSSWEKEINIISEFGSHHVSLYHLSVERGTALWKNVRDGKVILPKEDLLVDMMDLSLSVLKSKGLMPYEISNFSTSFKTQCQHNNWIWSGGEFVGVGPGAHGRFSPRASSKTYTALEEIQSSISISVPSPSFTPTRQSRIQTLEPLHWLREVELVSHGTRKIQILTLEDRIIELLASSLRTSKGLSTSIFEEVAGFSVMELLKTSRKTMNFLESGLLNLSQDAQFLTLSSEALRITDYILPYLVRNLNEFISHKS